MAPPLPTHLSAPTLPSPTPLPNISLPAHIARTLPQIQSVRVAAYNRLNAALRPQLPISDPIPTSQFPSPTPSPPDYPTICAHVTEDLKLASEAVIALRGIVAAWPDSSKTAERDALLRWIDDLQALEERKLVATVSLHAVKRSARLGVTVEDAPAKIGRFATELDQVDRDINELLLEIRESCSEQEERGTG